MEINALINRYGTFWYVHARRHEPRQPSSPLAQMSIGGHTMGGQKNIGILKKKSICISIYMYIWMYIYMYIYMYMIVYVYVYMYVYVYVYVKIVCIVYICIYM